MTTEEQIKALQAEVDGLRQAFEIRAQCQAEGL